MVLMTVPHYAWACMCFWHVQLWRRMGVRCVAVRPPSGVLLLPLLTFLAVSWISPPQMNSSRMR